jgi:threonine dehydrogenase-like Zn-dependent dehydrogenase
LLTIGGRRSTRPATDSSPRSTGQPEPFDARQAIVQAVQPLGLEVRAGVHTGLVDLIWNREIDPGRVFDLTLLLDQVAEGYRAMDERRAIKALLWP